MKLGLSKTDTKMLQGLAVIGMLCLHLFNRWDYEGLFRPLVFIKGIPLSFYIGQLGDFCAMCFAFCTGYAHMTPEQREKPYPARMKSLFQLIVKYWIVVGIAVIAGLLLRKESIPGSLSDLAGNVFFYNMSYCGAWWYLYAYIVLVVASPILVSITEKAPAAVLVMGVGALYTASYIIRFRVPTTGIITPKIGPLGMTVAEYFIGTFFYKYNVINFAYGIWTKLHKRAQYVLAAVLLVILLLGRTLVLQSLYVAPVSGILVILLFLFVEKGTFVRKFFLFVGEHSTVIWLSHMFFMNGFTNRFAYRFQYPILIFSVCMGCGLGMSYIVASIEKLLHIVIEKPRVSTKT